MNEENQSAEIDWTHDSVRLLGNGERFKVMAIVDVTDLTESQRQKFVNRTLAALTKMGKKVMSEK